MKVDFLTELDVRKIEGRSWRLLADFVCLVDGARVVVPAGFVTDFASVPRLPFAHLFVGDVSSKAPVLHDFLYSSNPTRENREHADDVFRAALEAEGIDGARGDLMYLGVRLGGSFRTQR